MHYCNSSGKSKAFDYGKVKRSLLKKCDTDVQPEINMVADIFGTTTDRIKIPTANLGFSTTTSSKKLSPGYYDNDRQPEMSIWLPKPEIHTSISRNMTDRIEIPTADLGFSTTASLKKLLAAD